MLCSECLHPRIRKRPSCKATIAPIQTAEEPLLQQLRSCEAIHQNESTKTLELGRLRLPGESIAFLRQVNGPGGLRL